MARAGGENNGRAVCRRSLGFGWFQTLEVFGLVEVGILLSVGCGPCKVGLGVDGMER